MRSSLVVTATLAVCLAMSPPPANAQMCGGDCNLDCNVRVDEILTMIADALAADTEPTCVPGDGNQDGELTVDEIVTGVDHALAGCGNAFCSETTPATFELRAGVEQLVAVGAQPNTPLTLYDAGGRKIVTMITDNWGQASFAYLPNQYGVYQSGPDVPIPTTDGITIKKGTYLVRNESTEPIESSIGAAVFAVDDVPGESFYTAQQLQPGYQYLTMRDGVKLSATVRFPDALLWGQPPYPTVIEYSGYGTSNPNSEDPGSAVIRQLGYATVGVNMRGSGCSGGIFDIFNPAQQADGYDIVEIVARQPWVLHGRPGMVGLSYAGIAQLYVASTRPPSLAAITSLSVIDDPWRQQWPGGVYNSGFTREWLEARDAASAPSGSSWVAQQIEEGDTICTEHQVLRNQNPDFETFGRALEYYVDDNDDRRLGLLVRKIEVPVYLTGGWQDEQTGSRFATMLDDFVSTDRKKFIVWNGRHPDGYGPGSISRWWEFLEFYVAKRTPYLNPLFRTIAGQVLSEAFGVPGLGFEPERFPRGMMYESALAQLESEPAVRVLFEVGGDHPVPNAPVARFEQAYDSWPPPAAPRQWYLGASGTLLDTPAAAAGVDRYRHDPEAGDLSYSSTGAYDFIYPDIEFDWPQTQPGYGLSYLTEPLAEDVVVAGNGGYVNLWFATDAVPVNVGVTLTDVREDGTETIVQSGVFNLGHRRGIDESLSDTFLIEYTYKEADFAPLVADELVEVKIPIQPFAHPFHAGSRVRLLVHTPGRDQPLWEYENPSYEGEVFHHVAYGPEHVSYVLLPVVGEVAVPAGIPPCNSLRGQICRDYHPLENEPSVE
jgi:predicted acyl esterase